MVNPKLNYLLASVGEEELEKIADHMTLVSLTKGQTLMNVGQIPSHVYYPVGAIVSMMNDMSDGYSIESYMIGNTGMVGMGTLNVPSFYRAVVRSSGLAYRLPVQVLMQELRKSPAYVCAALDGMRHIMRQMSQAISCGKHHSVDQQLIRWILVTLDRSFYEKIAITHQELSEILGFRREAITYALGRFSEDGYIARGRGEIVVLDRQALEDESCDCYWIAQEKKRKVTPQKYDRLDRSKNVSAASGLY